MANVTQKEEEIQWVRQEAVRVLQQLQSEVEALTSPPPSWIQGDTSKEPKLAPEKGEGEAAIRNDARQQQQTLPGQSLDCQFFNYTGFLLKKQFCAVETECEAMKQRMESLVATDWDPSAASTFGTSTTQNAARGDYFLDSSDRVHFFAEPGALQDGTLVPDFLGEQEKKWCALNKVGHGLHLPSSNDKDSNSDPETNPFFDYCTSRKIRELVLDLQWKDPVVPQSMYIFKNAHHGGVVHAHQDSTFLFTTPKQSCLGLWLALDDATLENGCLWVRPKSHHEAVRRQYKRAQVFGEGGGAETNSKEGGNTPYTKLVMERLVDDDKGHDKDDEDQVLPRASTTPRDLWNAGFVPVECRAGDLLVFSGTLEHLSLPNHSSLARHTFQLHLVEGPQAGVTWSPYNWLQYPDKKPFLRLLDYA